MLIQKLSRRYKSKAELSDFYFSLLLQGRGFWWVLSRLISLKLAIDVGWFSSWLVKMEVWESSQFSSYLYLPAYLFYSHSYGTFGWIVFVEVFKPKNFLFLVVGCILLKQEKYFFQFSAKYIWHPNLNKQRI